MPNVPKTDSVKTLVIDKFNGRLTRYRDGDINSGMANFYTSWGTDTFVRSGTLTFSQGTTDITKGVITDCIMAMKVRVESGTTYCYAIGHLGRIYKIQVNDLSSKNPNYDTPVLLATLTNAQTFHYGASLDFYQSTIAEKIWIGHDKGITSIKFDGTSETNFTAGWTPDVPRQQQQFTGSIYFTDGANLAQVGGAETVITHTALSPGFPSNSQARDIDVTADGRYLVMVVTRNQLGDMLSTSPDTGSIAAMPSQLFYWNGTDSTISSSTTFPSFSMSAYQTFSSYEYLFGYQVGGAMMGTPKKVLIVDEFTNAPLPNAITSSGDFVGWATTVFDLTTGHTNALVTLYGTIDEETPVGQYRQMIKTSTLTGGDVVRIPTWAAISSFANAGSSSGYTTPPLNLYGAGKSYFSTLEYNGSSTVYGFYMLSNVQSYLTNANTGVYETQHQVFSKQIKPTEVRVYYEPAGALAAGVVFKIDLVGIDGSVLTGGTNTFSTANQLTATSVAGMYNPTVGATPVLGVRVTNIGIYTPYIHRIEIDYTSYGN